MTIEQRFWAKVAKTDMCWTWTGGLTTAGYASFWIKNRVGYGHRYSYELANGPIANGLFVCHHCDNPRCVRPDHLFLGSQKDNLADMARKGRRRWHCTLNRSSVHDIRAAYQTGESQGSIARRYGVHQSTISHAVRGLTWKHVEGIL